MNDNNRMVEENLLSQVKFEMKKAINDYPAFNSLHEGYAVLLEEVDELWEHVKRKQTDRNYIKNKIHSECIQIAAMALRIIVDCGKDDYSK